jgi:hypothetical protein
MNPISQKIYNKLSTFAMLLSKSIHDSYNKCVKRNHIIDKPKKTNFIDALLFLFMYTNKGSHTTQTDIADELNVYKCTKINRSNYIKRIKKLDCLYLEDIAKDLIKLNSEILKKENHIICVDGTHSHGLQSLIEHGFSKKKFKKNEYPYINPLIGCIFDSTTSFPISLDLSKGFDERKIFLERLKKEADKFVNCIFIFDRGYFSYEVVLELDKLNIKYLMRIHDEYAFVVNTKKSYNKTINMRDGDYFYKIRTINLWRNSERYIFATNLMSNTTYSVDRICNIYKERWEIEKYFLELKNNLKFDFINTSSDVNYKKIILADLIVSQIKAYIERILYDCNNEIKDLNVINKGALYNSIFKILLAPLITNKLTHNDIDNFLKFVHFSKTRPNRNFPRIGKLPHTKWHSKQHLNDLNIAKTNKKKENKIKGIKPDDLLKKKKPELTINDLHNTVFIVYHYSERSDCRPKKFTRKTKPLGLT